MPRNRLLNRRRSESRDIAHNGHKLTLTVGFYDDGRVGECFVASPKIGSELEATARDGAILISLLLQNQVAIADINHSLAVNPDGSPGSIIGTVVKAMLDPSKLLGGT
jgi:ribonucleoside-diphosphate reductase alpha chain